MKFVYVDESGTGNEPIAVMCGIIADSHRMRITKVIWNNLLETLSEIIGREIREIHTRDFYSGNSPWRDLNGNQRSAIIDAIFAWLKGRKHSLTFAAVDKQLFRKEFHKEKFSNDVTTLWRFLALHLTLSLQKYFQGSARGEKRKINSKGMFVLIFDDEKREQKHFTDLILNAPDWTDSYYDKKEEQEKISQLVDVPHFVDSKDVGLIQLADFVCFFLRKFIELKLGYTKEAYDGEIKKVERWADIIFQQSIPISNIYLKRGRCDCSELFYKYAPSIFK